MAPASRGSTVGDGIEAFCMETSKPSCASKNPVETASLLSIISFSWINPLIRLGITRQLELTDLFPPHSEHTTEFLSSRLEKTWLPAIKDSAKTSEKRPRFWRHALWPYRYQFSVMMALIVLEMAQRVASCVVLRHLLLWLQGAGDQSLARGYGLAMGLGLLALIFPITHHQFFNMGIIIGWNIRVQTMALVNKKLLALSAGSLAHVTTGHCINLMSNDVRRFDELFLFGPFIFMAPLEMAIVVVLIVLEIGVGPAMAGMAFLLALIPLQAMFARFLANQRSLTAKFTDQRVKITSEVLHGILAVKMSSWEKPFTAIISQIRDQEKKFIRRASFTNAFNESTYFCGAAVVALVTFVTYYYTGGVLHPSTVFYVLSLIQLPRLWMCVFFPSSITKIAESTVSFSRLQRFLSLPEMDFRGSQLPAATPAGYFRDAAPGKPPLSVHDAAFSWSSVSHGQNLKGVSFELNRGELLGVTGRVGSGKSTLVSAILGDLHVQGGSLTVRASKMAYASQKPFIIAGTLRENILFGSPLDMERYNRVLAACALCHDIAQLAQGDETEIGERGINLSGGQKARVGLARAAYADSDLVLLDDPLSAVDPAIGRQLFEQCIAGIMQGRSVIVVTHQLQYLPRCDRVVLLDDGEMVACAPFADLQGSAAYQRLVSSAVEERAGHGGEQEEVQEAEGKAFSSGAAAEEAAGEEEGDPSSSSALVQKESREEGNVSLKVYLGYAKKMGPIRCIALFVLLSLGQALLCCSDWFLAFWSHQSNQDGWWIHLYIGLVVAVTAVSFLRSVLFFVWSISASSRIQSSMLASVLDAPLRFFHSHPVGRVLNRFSADQGILDDMLPLTLFNTLQMLFMCCGALVVVSLGLPWLALSLLPLLLAFLFLRHRFLCSSREVKRLEAMTRSPVYTHYTAAIQGLSTIRAFQAGQQFIEEFQRRLDVNGQAYFAWFSTSRWLAFRLDSICGAIVFCASLLAIVTRNELSPVLVGLALTYTLQLAGQVQWTVRQSAETENLFVGVERVLEYTALPKEGARVVESNRPPEGWPQLGSISVEGLTVRYDPSLPPVLSDVCFSLPGGHKCGVVGRTGAGKSTLMLALFRLVEASEGRVLIDGLDIASIGLDDLRRNVMAIPQDPVLFGSSLRFNLDPFEEFPDDKLWDALQAVQLFGKAKGLENGLETSMAEFGENFSAGERQLVCLARAIMHRNRILVMDEATANVDLQTDALIQKTLRETFVDSTVVMIAHRMDTIIDAHEVLVLERGKVSEFGRPEDLLQNEGGAFSLMVQSTGVQSQAMLRNRAMRRN